MSNANSSIDNRNSLYACIYYLFEYKSYTIVNIKLQIVANI